MALQHELVGIIEIDAEPGLPATRDETFALTLRSLRTELADSDVSRSVLRRQHLSAGGTATIERVDALSADLGRLHTDLKYELRQLIDRLLAAR